MTKTKRSRTAIALGLALESYKSQSRKRKEERQTKLKYAQSRSGRTLVGGNAPSDEGKNNFDRSEIIGTKGLIGSSLEPATFGPRSLYSVHQPGSGRFNFQPKTLMSNFIANRSQLTYRPQNSNPMKNLNLQ